MPEPNDLNAIMKKKKKNDTKEDCENGKKPFFPNLMKQSTIYRRHEARLARTYTLKDDPRPAFIRVLSGLPGFRMIVPAYEPNKAINDVREQKKEITTEQRIGTYSEDTIFAKKIDSTKSEITPETQKTEFSPLQKALQAMLVTSVCGGATEFIFGSALYGKSTPFARTRKIYSASPFFTPHGDSVGISMNKKRRFVKPSVTGKQIALAASSCSLMFGTKVLLDEQQTTLQIPSIVSSGCAGAVAATATAPFQNPSRHIIATTLYFSAYEQCRDITGIAPAGALAGCVHAIALTDFQIGWHRCLPAMARAAPTHALIFTGYELMKKGVQET